MRLSCIDLIVVTAEPYDGYGRRSFTWHTSIRQIVNEGKAVELGERLLDQGPFDTRELAEQRLDELERGQDKKEICHRGASPQLMDRSAASICFLAAFQRLTRSIRKDGFTFSNDFFLAPQQVYPRPMDFASLLGLDLLNSEFSPANAATPAKRRGGGDYRNPGC